MWHVFKDITLPFDSYRLPRQEGQITFTRSTDPDAGIESLSTQIIREHPKFGAERFLKLLGQEQGNRRVGLCI